MPADALIRSPALPDRWLFGALLLLLAWLPWPWGSRTEAATAFFGAASSALTMWRLVLLQRGAGLPVFTRGARVALGMLLAWLGWLVFQITPLPATVLAVLSPSSHAVHAAVAALPAGGASFTPSILPGATLDLLLLSGSYLCLFWLVLVSVARNRPRQRLVLTTLVFTGLAQALYGTVMTLSGWEYGFFEPKVHGIGLATGTFVNRNHLAGYLELALGAGIALVLADLRTTPTRGWRQAAQALLDLALSPKMRTRVMLAVMVIALVLTRSRMGNIAFFTALGLCGGTYVFLRHRRYFLPSLIFVLSLFVVDLMILSKQFGLQQLAERIEATDPQTEQRTVAFQELRPLLAEYALTGSGLGTFGAAYSPHRSEKISGYFDHAHNDHLEFAIETGIVGYGLLFALGTWTLFHALTVVARRRDPMACALGFAGAMGLVSLGIHGLADFNLRVPAVAATLIALMALTLSCSSRSSEPSAPET